MESKMTENLTPADAPHADPAPHPDTFSAVLSEHERYRTATLVELIKRLKNFPQDASREDFARLFARAQSVLELDDLALAKMLRVSRPTVGRWARGETAPHPIGRTPVFHSLSDVARSKLKHYADSRAKEAA
jgi:hypothetical protein